MIHYESVNEAKEMTFIDYLKILDKKFTDVMNAVNGENGSDAKIVPTRGDILQNFTLFRNYLSVLTKKYSSDKTKLKFITEYSDKLRKLESVNEQTLNEGVYDPGILKAIFLAGGPGSGKSFAVNQVLGVPENITTGLSSTGLKVVNSDPAFELFLKRKGVNPKSLAGMTQKVFDYYTDRDGSPRDEAKKLRDKMEQIYKTGRIGLVIDGTGHEYGKIATKKKELERMGYDTSMVFVDTDLPKALERNQQRDRVLPEDKVTSSWNDVQANKGKFKSLFGSDFTLINNSETTPNTKAWNELHKSKVKSVMGFVNKPVKNPIGKSWIENQKKIKSLG